MQKNKKNIFALYTTLVVASLIVFSPIRAEELALEGKSLQENSQENSQENTIDLAAASPIALIQKEDERCDMLIQKHIDVVRKSDELIFALARKKPTEVTPVDVTLLKDNLNERYTHLDQTLKTYNDKKAPCTKPVIAKALVAFDYHHFGRSALTSGHIRRAIKSITKFEEYGLTKLEKNYKKAVSKSNLKKIRKELEEEMQELPENLELNLQTNILKKGQFFNFGDSVLGATSKSVSRVAFLWGVLSDHLKWREGRIYRSEIGKLMMRDHLKPLDIIFEKRTFVLSNYTIPGHWGHVAVYLGTKDELIELGVWENPEFQFFRQKVEEGFEIVEIRKSGMNFVKLDDFLNLDEVAVMRVRDIPLSVNEVFANLVHQAKKKYDFQFNAHSTHEITCTELITNSYGDINWKQSKNLGFVNMQPDDVAELSIRHEKRADLVLYLKGKKNFIEVMNEKDWNVLFE